MAMSASRSSSSAESRSPTAMPILAVTVSRVSSAPSLNGCLSASSSRSATSSGPAASESSSAMTTNSSPPRRPSASAWRTTPSRRAATARRSSSPTPWPSVSLIVLKLSTSMNSAATGVWLRVERANICSTRSRISVRLGKPVSGSWVARNASSSSRRPSSSSVRWRSCSNDSHTRMRLNSRLICSMLSACASASSEIFSSTALSRMTSAITLRHHRLRRVTSFSEAARWAASSPNIRDVSRAASLVTSRPSPAIQRATAIVEFVQMRSNRSCTGGSTTSPPTAVLAIVRLSTSPARAFSASPRRPTPSGGHSLSAVGGIGARGSAPSKLVLRSAISARLAGCARRWEIDLEQVLHALNLGGLAHEQSLRHRAAHRLQGGHLLVGFDPLCDHRQRQVTSDDQDRLEQPTAVVLILGGSERATVDLKEVDRQSPEIAMVGVAATSEVVDRDPHTEALNLFQASHRGADVTHDGGLGNLQGEQRRLDPRLLQCTQNIRGEAPSVQLGGRHLHGDAYPVTSDVPCRSPVASFFHHPAADRHDQPGFLSKRDEVLRRDVALLGMLPADACLESCHLACAEVIDRLVEQRELTVGECCVQLHLEHASSLDHGAHVRVEQCVAVLAGGLGGVQRELGVAQQIVGVRVAAKRQANAGRHEEVGTEVRELERLVQSLDDASCECVQTRPAGSGLDQDHELVIAEATDGVAGAHHRVDAFGHVLQQLIAGVVAEPLVDVFEPVDVDEQRTHEQPRLAAGTREHALCAVHHQRTVGQAGERVVEIVVRHLGVVRRDDHGRSVQGTENENEDACQQAESDATDQQHQRVAV